MQQHSSHQCISNSDSKQSTHQAASRRTHSFHVHTSPHTNSTSNSSSNAFGRFCVSVADVRGRLRGDDVDDVDDVDDGTDVKTADVDLRVADNDDEDDELEEEEEDDDDGDDDGGDERKADFDGEAVTFGDGDEPLRLNVTCFEADDIDAAAGFDFDAEDDGDGLEDDDDDDDGLVLFGVECALLSSCESMSCCVIGCAGGSTRTINSRMSYLNQSIYRCTRECTRTCVNSTQ